MGFDKSSEFDGGYFDDENQTDLQNFEDFLRSYNIKEFEYEPEEGGYEDGCCGGRHAALHIRFEDNTKYRIY